MHASSKNDLREGGAWTPAQHFKNTLIYLTLRGALALACVVPRPLLFAFCRLLALFAYLVLPRERKSARARLEQALGVAVPEARVRAAARSLGHTLADTLLLLRPSERARRTLRLDPDSARVLRAALGEGRGVVFITAHLGPFERMAALLAEEGFSVSTVARQSYDPRLTRLYDRLREPRGVRSIYRGTPGAAAAAAILRELKRGRSVGFLVDLPARVPSLPAQLFGATTLLPRGPARIALARRAPVLVGSCQPDVDSSAMPSLVTISRIPTADLGSQDESTLIERIAHELDERIARCPEAWLGLFARELRQLDDIPLPRLQRAHDSR